MERVLRWDATGLTLDEQCAVIRETMARKRDGLPSSFRFLDKPMTRLAAEKAAPQMQAIELPPKLIGAGNGNAAVNSLTSPTGNMRSLSLRDQSSEALIQAIHSPGDEGWVIDLARICLKLFFDPDLSVVDRAEVIDKFGRVLKGLPRSAVSRGFDQWEKTMQRRPSSADIYILADRECKRFRDELADRSKMTKSAEPMPERTADEKAEPERILLDAGFTVKRIEAVRRRPMATTEADMYQEQHTRDTHWSDRVAPDGPEMAALCAARLDNPIMRAALLKSEVAWS